MTITDDLRKFWLNMRQALLAQVDAIEVMLGMERTADIRRAHKQKGGKPN